MSKCSHGVWNSRYCQVCNYGCGGGIMPHDKPTIEVGTPICDACHSTRVSFDFELEIGICMECGRFLIGEKNAG